MNAVHFSSETVEWATPQAFFDHVDAEFGFVLDCSASDANHKCARYLTRTDNALTKRWAPGPVWMNPPYGRGIDEWVSKAWRSAVMHGSTVVCLLPARTDTAWWHDYCMKTEVRLLRGRLTFGSDAPANAPFPNALVIFRPDMVPSVTPLALPPNLRGKR